MSAQSDKAGSVVDLQTSEDGNPTASHNGQHRILQHHNDDNQYYSFLNAISKHSSPDRRTSLELGASVQAHRPREVEPRIPFETTMQRIFSSPDNSRHGLGPIDQQHTSVGCSVNTSSDRPHHQHSKEPDSHSREAGYVSGSTTDTKYACLRSTLPLIKDIIHPETALQLLHADFASAEDSLFNQASPYVLKPILCKEDVLNPHSARSPSAVPGDDDLGERAHSLPACSPSTGDAEKSLRSA